VTANGYQPVVQNVHLTAHETQNFQLTPSGSRTSLNGPFTLAIDVVGNCSGSPGLPAHLQHRTYEAAVTTTDSFVEVRLTEARFYVYPGQSKGNWFGGHADAAGVRFTLDGWGNPDFYLDFFPSVAERLSDNTFLVPSGTAATSRTNGGVSGPMTGEISYYGSGFPSPMTSFLGGCSSSGLRLTLTPR
jgi:hypothetical protein